MTFILLNNDIASDNNDINGVAIVNVAAAAVAND